MAFLWIPAPESDRFPQLGTDPILSILTILIFLTILTTLIFVKMLTLFLGRRLKRTLGIGSQLIPLTA